VSGQSFIKARRTPIVIALLIFILLGLGSIGFHTIEGWPWFKSLYTTLMTVSTIGAGPENEISPAGEKFNIILMFLGLIVVGFAIGSVTKAVVEFELGTFFGRRRMEKEISRLEGHFIICGAGRVGRRVASEVAARGLPLLVIEKDPAKAQWVQERGFPLIVGDASSEEVLHMARIECARALASAVTSDAQNVYIVLTARGIAPNLSIVARASEEDAESKLLRAGATAVVSPYSYAGMRIARTMTSPNVQRFIDLALSSPGDTKLDLEIEEIRVTNPSRLSGSTLAEADLPNKVGVIVLAIRRENGKLDFNPKPSQNLAAGDCLIVMGDSRALKDLQSLAGV
jgi:voltage-gated potassium channel